ncbi:MAG TPA: DUF1800 domain-containing protein [Terriglobales bacterium]|nr:DUF1800 domain-containing protein [Terriglobales bacterium]
MARTRRQTALLLLVSTVLTVSAVWAGNRKTGKNGAPASNELSARQRAIHALNRLTFGPRPGDVDRVLAIGVDKWIDLQLHPEKIDDSVLAARLAPLRTLNMDTRQLVLAFPPRQLVKAVQVGRMQMPTDPGERAIYQAQMQRMDQKQAQDAAEQQGDDNGSSTEEQQTARREAHQTFNQIMAQPADQRMNTILAMTPEQRATFAKGLRPNERMELFESFSPQQREQFMAMRNPQAVVVTELQQGKILRAAYSERQLEEVMTDFWFNHFNIFINKGPDRYLTTAYERDVIRPHALGKFKDLLIATAKSPAMLWYLDNWDSVGPNSQFARFVGNSQTQGRFLRRRLTPQQQARIQQLKQKAPKGLNENYARELMELHTLGVDGGYSQHDVTEVAKAFTGWTIKQPQRGGEYEFDERRHEPGPKFILGKNIKENGEKEGLQVLEMLARHPSTAHFISKKLAMRFVSDDPPPTLVNRMADTFLKTDGDIREVLRTMFKSPEFWSRKAYRAKVKTPFEFVVSALRATNADVTNALPLVQTLNKMGMPLYQQQPPTGYSMKADAWVNSAALLNRMNFSLALASGRMPGTSLDAQRLLGNLSVPSAEQALGNFENTLLAGDVSRQTHETILKQLSDPQVTGRVLDDPARPTRIGVVAGLILGSPEFQRR